MNGTFADFQERNATAHREAVVADVALAAGVALTGLTAFLYFGRSDDAAPSAPAASVSLAPMRSGGAVVVGGGF